MNIVCRCTLLVRCGVWVLLCFFPSFFIVKLYKFVARVHTLFRFSKSAVLSKCICQLCDHLYNVCMWRKIYAQETQQLTEQKKMGIRNISAVGTSAYTHTLTKNRQKCIAFGRLRHSLRYSYWLHFIHLWLLWILWIGYNNVCSEHYIHIRIISIIYEPKSPNNSSQ